MSWFGEMEDTEEITMAKVKFKGTRQLYDYVLPERLSFLKPDTMVVVPVGARRLPTLALFKTSEKIKRSKKDKHYVLSDYGFSRNRVKKKEKMATHKDIISLLFY